MSEHTLVGFTEEQMKIIQSYRLREAELKDRLIRTEENVYALKGELEGVKKMWRATIDDNARLRAALLKIRNQLLQRIENLKEQGAEKSLVILELEEKLRNARAEVERMREALSLIGGIAGNKFDPPASMAAIRGIVEDTLTPTQPAEP